MVRDKRALIDQYVNAYNAFDIEGMLAPLHDDVEFSSVRRGERNAHVRGQTQFRHLAEHAKRLFSSRQLRVLRYDLDQTPASVDVRFCGVLEFDMPDGPRQGETVEFEGRSEFTFQEGLIRRIIDIS